MPVAPGSQSARPTKRFRSAGPDDLHSASSPIAPQTVPPKRTLPFSSGASQSPQRRPASRESTVSRQTDSAPVAPMAPMAPMESPTTGTVLGSPIAEEISVSVQETVTHTPGASLFGLGSKLVGVLADAIPVGRKRSIEEVDTPTTEKAAHVGDDTAVELDNQLHDAAEARNTQRDQKPGPAPTATATASSSAPDSQNTSEVIAVNGSAADAAAADADDAANAADPVPAVVSEPMSKQDRTTPRRRAPRTAISKVEGLAKSSPPKAKPSPRRQRARKSINNAEAEAVAAAAADTDEIGKFEVDKIVDFRYNPDDPTLLDMHVSWKDGERTWEPEANVQEDAPDVLFKFWRSVKGGRSSALKPDMWHVLRIEKHQVKSGDISVYVAWIGSPRRSWEPEDAVAGYAGAHLDDYWESLGGRDIVLGAQTVSAPKRRGRPPKSSTAKSSTTKPAIASAPATAPTTKRQKRGSNEKETKAVSASGRPTRRR